MYNFIPIRVKTKQQLYPDLTKIDSLYDKPLLLIKACVAASPDTFGPDKDGYTPNMVQTIMTAVC